MKSLIVLLLVLLTVSLTSCSSTVPISIEPDKDSTIVLRARVLYSGTIVPVTIDSTYNVYSKDDSVWVCDGAITNRHFDTNDTRFGNHYLCIIEDK